VQEQQEVESWAADRRSSSLARDLTVYTLIRLAILGIVAGVLAVFHVPLLVGLAVALVLALPLSAFVFRGLRFRVTSGLARRSARRKAERARLMTELRGEKTEDQ
jgi:hypothetical protein